MLTFYVMKKVSDVVMFSPPRSYTVRRIDRARSGDVLLVDRNQGDKGLAFFKDTQKRSSLRAVCTFQFELPCRRGSLRSSE
jgi:hypothetical protein